MKCGGELTFNLYVLDRLWPHIQPHVPTRGRLIPQLKESTRRSFIHSSTLTCIHTHTHTHTHTSNIASCPPPPAPSSPHRASKGTIHLAFSSLSPGPWGTLVDKKTGAPLPVRADGAAALKAMGTSVLRIGGSFAAGQFWSWRKWRGPVHLRPELDPNSRGNWGEIQNPCVFSLAKQL